MIIIKKKLFKLFFILEVSVIAGFYFFGNSGLQKIYFLQTKKKVNFFELQAVKKEVLALERKVEEWRNNPFYKEKFAREVLLMARDDEQVYFIE